MSLFGDSVAGRPSRKVSGSSELVRKWEPTDAYAWYAADFAESIYSNLEQAKPGEKVTTWADLIGSSNAENSGAFPASPPPIYSNVDGRPGIHFGYTDEDRRTLLSIPGLQSWSNLASELAVFVVGRMVENPFFDGTCATFYASRGNNSGAFRFGLVMFGEGGPFRCGYRRTDNDSAKDTSAGNVERHKTFAHLGIHDHNNDACYQYVNSKSETSRIQPFQGTGVTDSLESTYVYIGNGDVSTSTRREFRGFIHEVIVYQRVPDQAEINGLMNHARDYWGVELTG